VKTISYQAFCECQNLADVTCLAENVPNEDCGIYNNTFVGSYIEYATLHVPAASVNAYKTTSPWSDFKNIVAIEEEAPSDARAATRSQADIKVVSDGIIISNTEPQSRCIIYSSDGQQVVNSVINDGTRKIALQQGQVYILTINGRTLKFAL